VSADPPGFVWTGRPRPLGRPPASASRRTYAGASGDVPGAADDDGFAFDIRIQGPEETVFFAV